MNKIVEVQNLSKSYGNHQVLNTVSLSIKQGSITGLLGPNGSGKTTFVKLLTGLLKDYSGTIQIDGQPISNNTKAIVSYLPDHDYFSSWMKVKDVYQIFVDFYEDFDAEKCLKMLEDFHISLSDKIKTMSKGTKEKLQLAFVMSRNAKLIILDEPLGGIDPAARDVILDTILSNYAMDQTILITTHLISDIERIFSDVIFLDEGRVTLAGDVDTLRQEKQTSINDLFKELYRSKE